MVEVFPWDLWLQEPGLVWSQETWSVVGNEGHHQVTATAIPRKEEWVPVIIAANSHLRPTARQGLMAGEDIRQVQHQVRATRGRDLPHLH